MAEGLFNHHHVLSLSRIYNQSERAVDPRTNQGGALTPPDQSVRGAAPPTPGNMFGVLVCHGAGDMRG